MAQLAHANELPISRPRATQFTMGSIRSHSCVLYISILFGISFADRKIFDWVDTGVFMKNPLDTSGKAAAEWPRRAARIGAR